MPDIIVASTTDNQEQVNQAAGGVQQDQAEPELKPPPTGNPQVESEEQPEPEQKEAKTVEEKPVPRGVEKRIDKLVRQNKELLEQLQAERAAKPAPVTKTEQEPPPVPMQVAAKFDSFNDWSQKQIEAGKSAELDDFLEARDAWKEARKAQQEAEQAAVAEIQEIDATYTETVNAFKAEHEDWDEVVGSAEIAIPTVAGNAIKQLENGPAVVYYLASNPEIAKEIGELEPVLAVAAIGRLSAALEKPQREETPTNNTTSRAPDRQPVVSKAPAPIKPLTGHAVRSTRDLSSPDISYEDYRKAREEQLKTRFRR